MDTVTQRDTEVQVTFSMPSDLQKHLKRTAIDRDTTVKALVIESVINHIGKPPADATNLQEDSINA